MPALLPLPDLDDLLAAELADEPVAVAPLAAAADDGDPGGGFDGFGLPAALLASVAAQGFERPTPIQAAAIPALLAGRDVVGQAQTGTGKTAAFALPLLTRVDAARRVVQALVLVPTRELANQVAAAVAALGRPLGVAVLPIYGGQAMGVQLQRLKRGAQVVVGTPGRVMDHLRQESLSLAEVTTVVLDEADEMLRMGFIEDVEWILEHAPGPAARQTVLLSATLPPPIRHVAGRHLNNPLPIAIEPGAPAISTIAQRVVWTRTSHKFDVLCRLLELEDAGATLVFTRTRLGAAELAGSLTAAGFHAEALHGELTQAQREAVLRDLRAGELRVVVATDVAARGLDVDSITLVVNFDAPGDAETYVHRIGRTGRAGRAGVSVLFLDPLQRRVLMGVERFLGQPLEERRAPSAADIAAHREQLFKQAVGRALAAPDLDVYRRVVEEIAAEGAHDPAQVAAALARLAAGGRPLFAAPEPAPPVARRTPAAPRERAGREPGRRPRPDAPEMVPLVLSVGREGGVRPGDVVGAIANEAGIPGRAIGAIEVRERVTLVEVDADHVPRVLERLEGATICGRPAHIRPAHSAPPPGPARSTARPARGADRRPSAPAAAGPGVHPGAARPRPAAAARPARPARSGRR
jgi:ATP-dependent RNA helicase DeaD